MPKTFIGILKFLIHIQEYLGFILAIGEAIRGKKITDPDIQISDVVKRLMEMLVRYFAYFSSVLISLL